MENNEDRSNRPAGMQDGAEKKNNSNQDAGGAKRRRSHRGGRRHHGGNHSPEERQAGMNAPENIGATASDEKAGGEHHGDRNGGRQNRQAGQRKPGDGNRPDRDENRGKNRQGNRDENRGNDRGNDRGSDSRDGSARTGDRNRSRQNGQGRPDRQTNGNRQNRPAENGARGDRSVPRMSDITPARVSPNAEPFPFTAETDADPIIDLGFKGLTAENYLDDPLCFAGTTPIPAVPKEPANQPDGDAGDEEKSAFATSPVSEIVGVRFRGAGKVYFFAPGSVKTVPGDAVIVETARGQEFGEVVIGNRFVPATDVVSPLRPVIRVADEKDRAHDEDNRRREEECFRVCREKIAAHKLDMKLVEAQYTFDNTKLLFYFTSDGRVDFRELVKDLAGVFHTRIELRQIGIRDEAKLLGGLGVCGRPLCCSTFLSDFGQVSIKMAKEQNLSLNSAKISGLCGRLMCCLRYEHEVYAEEIRLTPAVDTMVRTADGIGKVTAVNPLAGTVRVFLIDSPDTPQKMYHRDNVEVLSRNNDPDRGQGRGQKRGDRPARNDAGRGKDPRGKDHPADGNAEPVPGTDAAGAEESAETERIPTSGTETDTPERSD